ncbi:MAG: hypothetical protein ACP5UA_04285 [Candidatus Hydrogenedens sp.]
MFKSYFIRNKIFQSILIIILLSSIICIQFQITSFSKVKSKELLYLPNEKLLRYFTAGLDTIIADFLWIHCLLYVGAEIHGDFSFEWLEKMLNAVVQLDPYFREVYRFGSVFLSSLRADSDSALKLLHRGIYYRPETWDLPYEAGMIYLLNRTNEPGSRKLAGMYLAMSSATGKTPQFIIDLAEKLNYEHDLIEIERDMWSNLLKSGDKLLRDLAERKLLMVEIKQICRELTARVEKYKQANNKLPEKLEEIGLSSDSIRDPLGGRFFISQSGKVENTTILDEQLERNKHLLENGIKMYYERFGTYPPTLQDILNKNVMTFLPEHPYEDREWDYNPETGILNEHHK